MSYNLSTKLRAKETAVNVFHVSKDASPHLKVSLEKRMMNNLPSVFPISAQKNFRFYKTLIDFDNIQHLETHAVLVSVPVVLHRK